MFTEDVLGLFCNDKVGTFYPRRKIRGMPPPLAYVAPPFSGFLGFRGAKALRSTKLALRAPFEYLVSCAPAFYRFFLTNTFMIQTMYDL